MWIFTKHGLLSVVADNRNKHNLLVRARQRHHISRIVPYLIPDYTPNADYHWRVSIRRLEFSDLMADLIGEISYPNFKNAADPALKSAYVRVWSDALELQTNRYAEETELAHINLTGETTGAIVKTIGDLFRVPPSQWGWRGDPYLWEEMRRVFKPVPLPSSADTLMAMLEAAFFVLTSHPISTNEEEMPVIDRFQGGGMTSGGVYPPFWREEAMPLIIERFVACTSFNRPPST
jgi:hypothetical protein